jgi:hypothetical protein
MPPVNVDYWTFSILSIFDEHAFQRIFEPAGLFFPDNDACHDAG